MTKQKNKKRIPLERIKILLLLSVFISATMSTLFVPQKALAYINTDKELSKSQQQDRTILYALRVCLEYSNFESERNRDELKQGPMPPIFKEGGLLSATPTGSVAVGYEIEPDDGNVSCNGLSLTRAMRFIDKDNSWFINGLYNRCGTNEDPPKYCFDDDGKDRIKDAIKRLAEKKRNGPAEGQAVGPKERARRHLIALGQCIAPAGGGVQLDDEEIIKIDGKKYKYKDGKDSGSNIAVGHDLETDGNASCGGLIDYFKNHPGLLERTEREEGIKITDNPDGTVSEGDEDLSDCDTKLLNPLSWILCPVIDIGANGSDYIFQNIIEPLLSDIPLSTNPDDSFFKAWQGFRFLANIILVAGMLGIVYSMARGDK